MMTSSNQMEVFFALLSLCEGNHRPPLQRPVFLSKQLTRRLFETSSRSLWWGEEGGGGGGGGGKVARG